MEVLPVEVLVGISFGLLVSLVPAVTIGVVSFLTNYTKGYRLPIPLVVVLALPLVGASGYYVDVVVFEQQHAPRLVTVAVVGVMLSLLSSSQGATIAELIPRNVRSAVRPERTLAKDAVGSVDGAGQVTIRPSGRVSDMEGYPSLTPALRERLSEETWRLPADLPLSELESRLESTLQTEFNLADATVSMDPQGQATIAAAPPSKDLSRKVPDGHRAVSVRALAPSGLEAGDVIEVNVEDATVEGTVLAISDLSADGVGSDSDVSGTVGGERRVTLSLPTEEASTLLATEAADIVVTSGGSSAEYNAFSLLADAGLAVRKVVIGDGDYESLLEDVEVIAVQHSEDGWVFDPDVSAFEPGQIAFVSGTTSNDAIRQFDPAAESNGGVPS